MDLSFFIRAAASLVIGYLLGSFAMAIIFSKLVYHDDVRKYGSKNAGTTNMARVYGIAPGLATLLGDILKTVVSMLLGVLLLGKAGMALGAVGCLIGHCWPLYFNFRGGKGVAVAAGIALMTDWKVFLILIAVFLLIAFLTRFVSLGSLTVSVLFPAIMGLFGGFSGWHYFTAGMLLVIIWVMHRGNIRRLLSGTEAKFRAGGKEK